MKPYYQDDYATIYHGDCREILVSLPDRSINCCMTSPPYFGLRDYGVGGQIGLEQTPEEYVAQMVNVFREVRRVLRDDATLWLNLGDSYNGSDYKDIQINSPKQMTSSGTNILYLKPKDLIGIPWRVAFALQADGWHLRQDIIWAKPNPMPESVRDRCTKSHEYIFLLSKSAKYYYDADAVAEKSVRPGDRQTFGGAKSRANVIMPHDPRYRHGSEQWGRDHVQGSTRNRRSVWTVATSPYSGAHFATFPPKLIEPCILAGCPEGGTVLDPFIGSGTTAMVAAQLKRKAIGIDLNVEYLEFVRKRITNNQVRLII